MIKSFFRGIDLMANLDQAKINAANKHNPAENEMIAGIQNACKRANIREIAIILKQIITVRVNGGMHKSKIRSNKSNRFLLTACLNNIGI